MHKVTFFVISQNLYRDKFIWNGWSIITKQKYDFQFTGLKYVIIKTIPLKNIKLRPGVDKWRPLNRSAKKIVCRKREQSSIGLSVKQNFWETYGLPIIFPFRSFRTIRPLCWLALLVGSWIIVVSPFFPQYAFTSHWVFPPDICTHNSILHVNSILESKFYD